MNALPPNLTLVHSAPAPRHIAQIDEAIEELRKAIGTLELARKSVTPAEIKTALLLARCSAECGAIVIAGAVEGL